MIFPARNPHLYAIFHGYVSHNQMVFPPQVHFWFDSFYCQLTAGQPAMGTIHAFAIKYANVTMCIYVLV